MAMDIEQLNILVATTEPFRLIHQDDDFVVVNKPARLLSVPGRHPGNHDCLVSRVQQDFSTALVVHRLDYDTSGLVILPLNKPALSNISKQFQARTVKKQYTAVVNGLLIEDQGEIDLPIGKNWDDPRCYKIDHEMGKASVTEFEVLDRNNTLNQSRVLLKPITGRSHQLRLHMLAIGHVILGDEFYAPEELMGVSSRLLLHSNQIEFNHPISGQRLVFNCDVPF